MQIIRQCYKAVVLCGFLLLLFPHNGLSAQEEPFVDLDYVTEVQTDFGSKFNWVNLFSLSAGLPTEKISQNWKNGYFNINLISVNKIREDRIADDLMTFSNIEEDFLPFNAFVLGYTHKWEKFELFGGIRNVNNDYFITPYTSLFTNSSAGIFPTLSLNFPLANYPLSAVCVHLEYMPTEQIVFKSSLYNGVAHDPRKNVFRSFTVNPQKDGIFSISEFNYMQNKFGTGRYALGVTMQSLSEVGKYAAWVEIEQSLYSIGKKEIGCIIHTGIAPEQENPCRYYYAVGGYFANLLSKRKEDKAGIYLNTTEVSGIKERTMEVTWQLQINNAIAIQPTFHHVRTGDKTANIGLVRFLFSW